ncbi:transposase, partial [Enterobacter hormaechei]|uniref:transposase n=1 Tax=Enterobacter hormaechei TaxID=158836 RepID=UPI000A8CA072
ADAAYAIPAIYERLEEARFFYAIRLPANAVLKDKIAHRLTRPVGRPSLTKVKRFFEEFEYQAASWDKERRVIAKIEWQRLQLHALAYNLATFLRCIELPEAM